MSEGSTSKIFSFCYCSDAFDGSGVFVDSFGNIYEGEFKNGSKCGMGKIQYEKGDSYIGAFENDDFHGQVTK
jgi:hypothetical protein